MGSAGSPPIDQLFFLSSEDFRPAIDLVRGGRYLFEFINNALENDILPSSYPATTCGLAPADAQGARGVF